ncbi:MAG: hypothetical protein JXM70_19435 [Pirellulales bacterium]|nr:hypothetical protein [Pirellulales bacterium]
MQQALEAYNQGVIYTRDDELEKALLAFDKAIGENEKSEADLVKAEELGFKKS